MWVWQLAATRATALGRRETPLGGRKGGGCSSRLRRSISGGGEGGQGHGEKKHPWLAPHGLVIQQLSLLQNHELEKPGWPSCCCSRVSSPAAAGRQTQHCQEGGRGAAEGAAE